MTIEMLDKRRVLISLKQRDMDAYALSIDKLNVKDSQCRDVLKNLLQVAAQKFGLVISDKAVLLEAMPHKEGLLILMTVDDVHKIRKVYKVKRASVRPCCGFSDAEGLLSCVEKLKNNEVRLPANSLWMYKDCFFLVFEMAGISPKAKAILSEYSRCMSATSLRIARIKEAGKKLLDINAVDRIAQSIQN